MVFESVTCGLPNRGPLHICIMQVANDCTRHGQKCEKEKNCDHWIEWFPFDNFFRRKMKNVCLEVAVRLSSKSRLFQFHLFFFVTKSSLKSVAGMLCFRSLSKSVGHARDYFHYNRGLISDVLWTPKKGYRLTHAHLFLLFRDIEKFANTSWHDTCW